MKRYQFRVPDTVAGLLRELHPHLKKKIKYSLQLVLQNPKDGKELRGELKGLWSLRVSRFRIIYRIHKQEIEVIAIGPCDRIYEETQLILRKAKTNR